MAFSGICLTADVSSDGCPCGADKPVQFSYEAINNALHTFEYMGVNCVYDNDWWSTPADALTGHDLRFKIGVVDKAELYADGQLNIEGILWKHDFYDVCTQIKNAKDSLGFSVEVIVHDMEDAGDFLLVKDFEFTGVAILYKNLAAFKHTQLVAQRQKESDNRMNDEQMKQFMDSLQSVVDAVNKVELRLSEVNSAIEKLEAKEVVVDFKEVTDAMAELGTKIEAKEATPAVPTPKTEPTFVGKGEGEQQLTLQEQIAQIETDASIPSDLKAKKKIEAFLNFNKQ